MLHKKTLDTIANEATGSLLDRKGCDVEIYRSIDKKRTGEYFGVDRLKDAEFEVVVFKYVYDKHTIYVKYPDTDFYIEMFGGTGSSRGNITECNIRNILKERTQPFAYENVLRTEKELLLKHDDYAVYKFGITDFNFLKRVAVVNNKSYGGRSYGDEYVAEMLNRKFVPIPSERKISYSFVTSDSKFVIVDHDAYNFQYETMRCFYGDFTNGIKLGEIKNFARYRDGGTTLFDCVVDGVTHKFFSPANLFGKTDKQPTWDGEVMTEMPSDAVSALINGLNIKLAPKVLD